jgi:hypothetical protein
MPAPLFSLFYSKYTAFATTTATSAGGKNPADLSVGGIVSDANQPKYSLAW